MVLKGLNWVHNDKIRLNGIKRSQLGTQCKNQVIWTWKRSQLGTQCKIQVIWSWKGWIGYPMIKSDQMVLKGVNKVHSDKIGSNGLERSQLGTQLLNEANALERSQLGTQWKN